MGNNLELTTNLQLALAHYCDIHGPTPLMVTEGLPATCTTCYEDPAAKPGPLPRPASSLTPSTTPKDVADGLRNLSVSSTHAALASDPFTHPPRGSAHPPPHASQPVLTPDTPPGSPRQPYPPHPRRDSSFRRTYDDSVTKKQGPCENCAMTLPGRSSATTGAVDDPVSSKGPTLRTRAPAERVFGTGGQASPPHSQSSSSDSDGEKDAPRRPRNRTAVPATSSRTTSCSSTSISSETAPFHVHYIDYTSTHDPILPNSFSLLRASCLRTLSFETLPRAPATATGPTSSPLSPGSSFVTTQSAGSAVSGGPIFFGDALAGYTTAYIFRIPDVHARGHKRVYAFLALSTHKERLAMKTFAIVSAAFRELAIWIQQLAEAEAERSAEASPVNGAFYTNGGGHASSQQPPPSAFDASTASTSTSAAADRSGSSFLTGGSGFTRRNAGGGGGSAPKARGLTELVGQPNFFIQLHRKFVQLFFEVGVTLNS